MATIDLGRSRWAAIGAAVAVTLGAGGLFTASAAVGSGERTVFVPVTPCRIMDTRPAPDNRGPRTTPLAPGDTHTIDVHGTQGDCNVPADAVAVAMNVTALNSTGDSFLTVFAAGADRPTASSLNWRAGQAPTPNAVTADLPADGRLSFYNFAGTVDVIADVTGYYADHNHDDRYYTKAQVDTAIAGKISKPTGTAQLELGPGSFSYDGVSGPGGINFSGGSISATSLSLTCWSAPVDLPNGSTVTAFSMVVVDNSTSAINATLYEDPNGGPGISTTMAEVNSTGQSSATQTFTTGSITSADVDAANSTYLAAACIPPNTALFGMTVTYTNP